MAVQRNLAASARALGIPERRDGRSGWGAWALGWPAALFFVGATFAGADLAADAAAGMASSHIVIEGMAFGLALFGVAGGAWHLRRALARARRLQRELRRAQRDVERWRAEAARLVGPAVAASGPAHPEPAPGLRSSR